MSKHDAEFVPVDSLEELQRRIDQEPALLVWFSTPACNVCKVLRPNVGALLRSEFPRIARGYVDCAAQPEIAAQFGVFTVPTVAVFFDGREALRKGRSFGLAALRDELHRPYRLLFG